MLRKAELLAVIIECPYCLEKHEISNARSELESSSTYTIECDYCENEMSFCLADLF